MPWHLQDDPPDPKDPKIDFPMEAVVMAIAILFAIACVVSMFRRN